MFLNKVLMGLAIVLAAQTSVKAWATEELWTCDGGGANQIESISVAAEEDGSYAAGVTWDCFPGGGICATNVRAKLVDDGGKLTFAAHDFKLVIHTELAPKEPGLYYAHISATGQGPEDEGGGMTIEQNTKCTKVGN